MTYDQHMTIQIHHAAAGHLPGSHLDQWPTLIDALRWNGRSLPCDASLEAAGEVCRDILIERAI